MKKIEELERLQSLLSEAAGLSYDIWDGDGNKSDANLKVYRCNQKIRHAWVYARDAKEMLINPEKFTKKQEMPAEEKDAMLNSRETKHWETVYECLRMTVRRALEIKTGLSKGTTSDITGGIFKAMKIVDRVIGEKGFRKE